MGSDRLRKFWIEKALPKGSSTALCAGKEFSKRLRLKKLCLASQKLEKAITKSHFVI